MNDTIIDNALNLLLNKAKSVSNPNKPNVKHIAIPIKGGYSISDIKVIGISASIEYGTWSVEIALKKDDESKSSLKRFKMVISENAVYKWQKIQMAHMKRTLDIDIDDDFNFEEIEPIKNIGSTVIEETDTKIISNDISKETETMNQTELIVCDSCHKANTSKKDENTPFSNYYKCECGNSFHWLKK